MASTTRAPRRANPLELDQAVRHFLSTSKQPVLEEPGEAPFALAIDQFSFETAAAHLAITAWDEHRNLTRRAIAIEDERPGRLKLTVERFGSKLGFITLYDAARPTNQSLPLQGRRTVFREHFRLMLKLGFPGWKIEAISSDIDLQHSLSPKFPRALLRQGTNAWAAIASPADCAEPDEILTYGLIWLAYLRRREPKLTVQGLLLFLPADQAKTTAIRLQWMDASRAAYHLFLYDNTYSAQRADLSDWGNLSTRLDVCRRPLEETQLPISSLVERTLALPGVEGIESGSGSLSLRVNGLEFGVFAGGRFDFGIEKKRPAETQHWNEICQIVETLRALRDGESPDKQNLLYSRQPERWLESAVRSSLAVIEPWIYAAPVYGQVPGFTGTDRGIIDLLAVDRDGVLSVIELKAFEDPNLPLQALDYWIRVNWHALRGEFSPLGYFPGIALRRESPRLMLVAPALEFHPTTETILHFFSSQVQVERIGLALEWRHRVRVLFRLRGANPASIGETT